MIDLHTGFLQRGGQQHSVLAQRVDLSVDDRRWRQPRKIGVHEVHPRIAILKKAAAAHETRNYLQTMGYRQSMSGKGNCYDNAPMESFWHSLKVEETHGRGFETREEARRCVFGYIEGFYNTTRMHSSLDWQSPREFRAAFERGEHTQSINPSATVSATGSPQRPPEAAPEGDLSGELCTGRSRAASPTSQAGMRPVRNSSGKSEPDATSCRNTVRTNQTTALSRR